MILSGLIASLILNIVLLAGLVAMLIWGYANKSDAELHMEQWKRWEGLWYEAQGKLSDEHGLYLSSCSGEYGRMVIKKIRPISED